jgi:glycosyltransferase involved in cell wall biosynthesis
MTTVCHIIKATRLSGAERHLLILLPALRERGINAHLLLLVEADKPMDNIVALAEASGVPVTRLVIRRGVDLTIVGKIRAELQRLNPDIVHTHLIHADVFGMLAATGRHVVTTRHNDDTFRNRTLIRWVNWWNWRGVKAGIVISHALAKFVREVEHAPTDKVRVIHYGVKNPRVSPQAIDEARLALRSELALPDDALLLGIVSRLTEQKGIPYALEAFKPIASEFPSATLVIAGDGEMEASLKARVQSLGLQSRVKFLGWREDAQAVLRALDVFLMPSLWEGFGLTLLEAMSARVPVVASHVSAIPEIVVHGETGYLVAARDPEAIEYALRLLLPDRLLRQHLGLNGEDRVESVFGVGQMAEKTIGVYRAVMEKK